MAPAPPRSGPSCRHGCPLSRFSTDHHVCRYRYRWAPYPVLRLCDLHAILLHPPRSFCVHTHLKVSADLCPLRFSGGGGAAREGILQAVGHGLDRLCRRPPQAKRWQRKRFRRLGLGAAPLGFAFSRDALLLLRRRLRLRAAVACCWCPTSPPELGRLPA